MLISATGISLTIVHYSLMCILKETQSTENHNESIENLIYKSATMRNIMTGLQMLKSHVAGRNAVASTASHCFVERCNFR
jgi:hypothetical protein